MKSRDTELDEVDYELGVCEWILSFSFNTLF